MNYRPLAAHRGFTLVELIVSVGLFAIVMTLAAGAYLLVIGVNQQTQGVTTGINNLSFALESMTRTIRTGTRYGCGTHFTDCASGSGGTFVLYDASNVETYYKRSISSSECGGTTTGCIVKSINGGASWQPLTDPSVSVTSLTFYLTGSQTVSGGADYTQPYVLIVAQGTISVGPGKTRSFSVETSAIMRGTDL